MATRAIKPKRDDTMLAGFQSMPERAPSVMRDDQPTVTRILAMFGLLLFVIGVLAYLAPVFKFNYLVNVTWGGFFLSMGLGVLLFHAFAEKDVQYRRTYASFGLTLILIAVALWLLPFISMALPIISFGRALEGYFLSLGVPGLLIGLLLFAGILRNETDRFWRTFLLRIIGVVGILLIGFGMIGGQVSETYLLREAILEMILGLLYVGVRIGFEDNEDVSFWASLTLGLAGLATFALALLRSFAAPDEFLVPSGFTLMGFGLLYFFISLGSVSDWPFVVLVRRELASFFYSPIGYLVLFGLMAVAGFNFATFVNFYLLRDRGPLFEPIVNLYIWGMITVIAQMFVVPILTMRLLSEEQRSGTLEVLLTAPVNETTVVLSKFFGALIFYLLTWLPAWIFLVALRVVGGEPFDYRPVLTFNLALLATGSGFLAMGLFCSCLSRNQIIAAVLAFGGMVMHLGFYFGKYFVGQESPWFNVFMYISYLDLWEKTLEGHLAPRFLVFHVSATVFFLFLTVKVLEARKWK